MKKQTTKLLTAVILMSVSALASAEVPTPGAQIDPARFRYQVDSRSVFNNKGARDIQRLNSFIDGDESVTTRKTRAFENPEPLLEFSSSDIMGDLEAPDGEMWFYTGKFKYHVIPPHDNVMFTERLLQEYTFTVYDADMNVVGTIKDKIHYKEGERRAPLCELTPVVTRNFFNTDDCIELMVAVGINPAEGYGVHYHSYVYALDGDKDEDGYDLPIMIFNNLVGDIIEGARSEDGSDNFYFTFSGGAGFETRADSSFWDRLVASQSVLEIYGKALDEKGPRVIHRYYVPVLQYPGDQESVPPMISLRRGEDVYFVMQKYKEPFYNRYDDPMDPELTQREGNNLLIDIFKATGEGVEQTSSTEIPVVLDLMPDSEGNPTSLFSYFSIGNLRYRQDILFDSPEAVEGKPDFIITRCNYQPSSDGTVNSYFTYRNDGTLKNTLSLYSAGSRAMGDIEGYEPQQMFVSRDNFGYRYKFVDIYSAATAAEIDANYFYNDDSDSELLSINCDRVPRGQSYIYAFELRYPLVDEDENDILRFMYVNPDGSYDHTDYINMGKGVAYAQSYLSTNALKPHVYSISDTPAYMMLIKRSVEGSDIKIEQLMVAEAESEEFPEGKPLLVLGPEEVGTLTSIVPEFSDGDRPGRLFVYSYDSSRLSLRLYGLPLNAAVGSVGETEGLIETMPVMEGETIISDDEIKVFGIDGKLALSGLKRLDTSSLDKGVYIVYTQNQSFKFMK